MSRYPSAVWKPIRGTSTAALRKDILCFHTAVGYLGSTWNYFNRDDVGVYSHGCIGGIWGGDAAANLDGVAWQMADTNYRAAANLDGNYRIISWETADNAARPIQPWTSKQCAKIVEIMVDANRLDGIPLVLVPDSKPGRRGVAYHRLGCDPYRVAGGELWSGAYGKDCPTDPRIKQLPGLLDQARAIANGDDEVTPQDKTEIVNGVVDKLVVVLKQGGVLGDVGTVSRRDIVPGFKAVQQAIDAIKADDTVDDAKTAEIKGLLEQVLERLPVLPDPPAPAQA